jgi:hypothetical protein
VSGGAVAGWLPRLAQSCWSRRSASRARIPRYRGPSRLCRSAGLRSDHFPLLLTRSPRQARKLSRRTGAHVSGSDSWLGKQSGRRRPGDRGHRRGAGTRPLREAGRAATWEKAFGRHPLFAFVDDGQAGFGEPVAALAAARQRGLRHRRQPHPNRPARPRPATRTPAAATVDASPHRLRRGTHAFLDWLSREGDGCRIPSE